MYFKFFQALFIHSVNVVGSRSSNEANLNVTLADVHSWDNTVDQQLVIQLAKDPQVKVSRLVAGSTQEQRDQATRSNIELRAVRHFQTLRETK